MSILSPQQKRVLDDLMPIAKIATDGSRHDLRDIVLPRCSSLIMGPSGSGKSYLALQIPKILGLPCLAINMATWVLMASRSEPWTWSVIVEWLSNLTRGGVIVLDEIDKLGSNGGSEYNTFLRMEAFALLDSAIPPGLKMPEDSGIPFEWDLDSTTVRGHLENTLRCKVLIIGCGAWQHAWLSNSKTMGFSGETTGVTQKVEPPSREQILQSIEPELRQRFRDDLSILPPMGREDYTACAREIADQIPVHYRAQWRAHVEKAIQGACDGTLGMRAFEELILTAMVESKKEADLRRQKPEPINIGL